MQFARRFRCPNGQRVTGQHRARIQTCVHLHQGDPRLGITGQDRPLDRRRPAPARQQGGVEVNATAGRDIQHGLRQDQAIGRDDHRLGRNRPQMRLRLHITQGRRLIDRKPMLKRHGLDRTGCEFHAPSGRSIRLGQNQRDRVPSGDQGLQGACSKLRCARKDEAHHMVSRSSFSSFLRIRACLRRER